MQRLLSFELLSWWHAGSGRGAGTILDATVHRSPLGLPEIPGKTVKGLLRAAMDRAVEAGVVDPGRQQRWFGSFLLGDNAVLSSPGNEEPGDAAMRHLEEARFSTEPGELWFGSAVLPEAWQRWAARPLPQEADGSVHRTAPELEQLFSTVASTAIDQMGRAAEHTLRVREVAAPMTLKATLIGPDDDAWPADIEASLLFIHALGTRRNRGYGRLRATLETYSCA